MCSTLHNMPGEKQCQRQTRKHTQANTHTHTQTHSSFLTETTPTVVSTPYRKRRRVCVCVASWSESRFSKHSLPLQLSDTLKCYVRTTVSPTVEIYRWERSVDVISSQALHFPHQSVDTESNNELREWNARLFILLRFIFLPLLKNK